MIDKCRYRKSLIALAIIVGSALAARMVIGVLYFNAFDTFWYRKWAFSLPDGFFDVYARAGEIDLDYPPLYLFCLYFTGLAYRFFGADCGDMMQMFLMKFWPIIFDTLCVAVIYLVARKKGETVAIFAAALWAVNPSAVYNSAFWGQTDGLMAMLLIWAFSLADDRPILSCVVFAVAGLTKYQSLFFTPVLLIYIFRRFDLRRLLLGIAAAAGTVAAVFLPFMIGARNPLLFFDVYLGGANTYQYCTFNAYNFYGALGLNCTYDHTTAMLGLTYAQLNFIVLAVIIAATAYMMLCGSRQNIYVGGLFIMQSIFMFSTRMHERYQMVVLPFALLAYVTTRSRRFARQFVLLSIVTLINQAVILINVNHSTFSQSADAIMQAVSFINLAVYIHTAYSCAKYFFKEKENDLFKTKAADTASAKQ